MKLNKFTIDIDRDNFISLDIMQYYTLPLQVNFLQNSTLLELDNYDVSVELLKADNTFILQDNNIEKVEDKNGDLTNVAILVNENFTKVPGDAKIQIILTSKDKKEVTGSWQINVNVVKGVLADNNGVSKNVFNSLEELKNEIKNAENEIKKVEQSKNSLTTLLNDTNKQLNDLTKNTETKVNSISNNAETKVNNLSNQVETIIKENNVIPTSEYQNNFKNFVVNDKVNKLDNKNGFFDDIKIEGNTLVNVIENKANVISQYTEKTDNGCIFKNPIGEYNISYSTKRFKANTTYTVSFSIEKDSTFETLNCDLFPDNFQEFQQITSNGLYKFKFTTPNDITGLQSFRFYVNGAKQGICKVINFIILEGDYTNKNIEFFNGIKSTGEIENKINIKSIGKNLAKISENNIFSKAGLVTYSIQENRIFVYSNNDKYTYQHISFKIDLKPNTKYRLIAKKISSINNTNCAINIKSESNIFNYTGDATEENINRLFTTSNTSFATIQIFASLAIAQNNVVGFENIQIIEETELQTFENYEERNLLIDNMVLSGFHNGIKDTILNDKYIKKVDKVVFNGSENWVLNSLNSGITIFELVYKNGGISGQECIISDKFSYGLNGKEGIATNGDKIYISIMAAKLSSNDVAGFKKWLSSNNTTVYYPLQTEIITDFENIKGKLQSFKDGNIILENTIPPILTVNAPNTFSSSILTNSNNISNIVDIANNNDNTVKENTKKIETINTNINAINGKITTNTNNITKNINDIKTINSNINTINGNINTINTNITNANNKISANTNNINKNTTDINTNRGSILGINDALNETISQFNITQSDTQTILKMANGKQIKFYNDFFQIDNGQYPYGRDVKFPVSFPNGLIAINICGRRIGGDIFGLKNSEIWNINKEGFSFTGTMETGKVYAIHVMAIGY